MRISDWSSDVCSSDLTLEGLHRPAVDRDPDGLRAWSGAWLPGVLQELRGRQLLDQRVHPGPVRHPQGAFRRYRPTADGRAGADLRRPWRRRSEEHTSELQSLMRIAYAVFFLQ